MPRPPVRPPFLGREPQLTQLLGLLAAAAEGRPQLAVVRGPAGIGKTRLIEELGDGAEARGCRVAIGRAWLEGHAPPLWPWRAILGALDVLDEVLADRPSHVAPPFALFVWVLDQLRRAARSAPLLLVLDDAHLADESSLLLARLVARERDLAVLLILAWREPRADEATPGTESLAEVARDAVTIELDGLPEAAVDALLSANNGAADPALLAAAHAVTHGNPFHVRGLMLEAERGGGLQAGLEQAVRGLLRRLTDEDQATIAASALVGPDVSVYDVARAAGRSVPAVTSTVARAEALGLVTSTAADRFVFVHELVRHEAGAAASAATCLDAHARMATLLVGPEPEQVVRRAHHAIAAATRSREDAVRAVTMARDAARVLTAVDGFESAATLLTRAAGMQATVLPEAPAAALLVEQAEAVLACGRLAESRPLFRRTARAADREGNAVVLARAALGLGGVWISEHRETGDIEGMLALQARALDALPAGETVLRARLAVRLSAERAYRGGSVDDVLEAIETVRRSGDQRALAEALSLAHHALLTPEHATRRLAMAGDMIQCAAIAGDGFLTLAGLCWRTVDLFLLGSRHAHAALDELIERTDANGCRSLAFIARSIDAMRSIRAGRFEEAEAHADACFALGTEAGDADALAYHAAHLSAIRYYQGREAELVDLAADVAASPTLLADREQAFASASALFALRAGQPRLAHARLEQLARDGLASIPDSSSWLVTLVGVAEMADALEHRTVAKATYDALRPHAALPAMASLATVCFGSVHRALGLAARACGNLDLAVEHFSAAILANEELGQRPAAIQARAELGLTRLRRGGPADARDGVALVREATAMGVAIGMTGLVDRWGRAADARAREHTPLDGERLSMTATEGGRWRLALAGEVATVRDRVGLRYLHQLVTAPGRGIPAFALVLQGEVAGGERERGDDPLMDPQAIRALRSRIDELRARDTMAEDEHEELAHLVEALARATGLGGRVRAFADAPERARTAVRKALKRAIDEIAVANAAIGQHLAERVETGAVCCYQPAPTQRNTGA
jgi:tetratricopeptide (TPR) repeat protein